jgi:hypothetical protein
MGNDYAVESNNYRPLMGMFEREYNGQELVGKIQEMVLLNIPKKAFGISYHHFSDIATGGKNIL